MQLKCLLKDARASASAMANLDMHSYICELYNIKILVAYL